VNVSFETERPLKSENWIHKEAQKILEGRNEDISKVIDIEKEFGTAGVLQYEGEVRINEPGQESANLLNEEMEKGGNFYNIEISETLWTSEGKAFAENAKEYDLESPLFGVHMTGYRDPNGNDHIIHSDPKLWTNQGKKKLKGEGSPIYEIAESEAEEFTDEDTYSFTEGVKRVESYLQNLEGQASGTKATRWKGLKKSIKSLRKSYKQEKPVNIP
jgi:hypothetical protein